MVYIWESSPDGRTFQLFSGNWIIICHIYIYIHMYIYILCVYIYTLYTHTYIYISCMCTYIYIYHPYHKVCKIGVMWHPAKFAEGTCVAKKRLDVLCGRGDIYSFAKVTLQFSFFCLFFDLKKKHTHTFRALWTPNNVPGFMWWGETFYFSIAQTCSDPSEPFWAYI